jgi:methionyl-tRNA formyltransferase
MKIVLFCSHWMALPSIDVINSYNFLGGIVIPARSNEFSTQIYQIASSLKIPVFEFDVKNKDVLKNNLNVIKPDVCFVITFPHKIPEDILSIPEHGFLNFHCGLVPEYRGIEPIFWQIKNGEKFGGITVIKMDKGIDTGEVLFTEKLEILTTDTYGLHLNKLAMITMNPVKIMIDNLLTGKIFDLKDTANKQIFPVRKRPSFNDLVIDWKNQTSTQINAIVRAANPAYKGAVTFIRNIPFNIMEVSIEDKDTNSNHDENIKPGTVISANIIDGLKIKTADNKTVKINIISCQDGIFTGETFISIYKINRGEILTV